MLNDPTNLVDEAKNYLNLSVAGYHPLFFKEWFYEVNDDKKVMNHLQAKRVFHNTLKKLAKHKSPDRKKMALCSLPSDERKDFIKAWIKMTEVGTLQKNSELH